VQVQVQGVSEEPQNLLSNPLLHETLSLVRAQEFRAETLHGGGGAMLQSVGGVGGEDGREGGGEERGGGGGGVLGRLKRMMSLSGLGLF
jgi:hypothetical protein